MVMFNSYVSLPEGIYMWLIYVVYLCIPGMKPTDWYPWLNLAHWSSIDSQSMQHLRILAQWKGTSWNRRSICSTLIDWLFVWWIISLLIALLVVLWWFYVVHVIPTPSFLIEQMCFPTTAMGKRRGHGGTARPTEAHVARRGADVAASLQRAGLGGCHGECRDARRPGRMRSPEGWHYMTLLVRYDVICHESQHHASEHINIIPWYHHVIMSYHIMSYHVILYAIVLCHFIIRYITVLSLLVVAS